MRDETLMALGIMTCVSLIVVAGIVFSRDNISTPTPAPTENYLTLERELTTAPNDSIKWLLQDYFPGATRIHIVDLGKYHSIVIGFGENTHIVVTGTSRQEMAHLFVKYLLKR